MKLLFFGLFFLIAHAANDEHIPGLKKGKFFGAIIDNANICLVASVFGKDNKYLQSVAETIAELKVPTPIPFDFDSLKTVTVQDESFSLSVLQDDIKNRLASHIGIDPEKIVQFIIKQKPVAISYNHKRYGLFNIESNGMFIFESETNLLLKIKLNKSNSDKIQTLMQAEDNKSIREALLRKAQETARKDELQRSKVADEERALKAKIEQAAIAKKNEERQKRANAAQLRIQTEEATR